MKLIVNSELKDIKGEPLKDSSGKPWLISDALIQACQASVQGDNPSGEEKFKRWKLAQKISAAAPFEVNGPSDGALWVDLNIEELAMLKKLSGLCFSAVAVGPIWTALESK